VALILDVAALVGIVTRSEENRLLTNKSSAFSSTALIGNSTSASSGR
jgi:hypothetical protein